MILFKCPRCNNWAISWDAISDRPNCKFCGYKPNEIIKCCIKCGNEFKTSNWERKRCNKHSPYYEKEKISETCLVCGKTFKTYNDKKKILLWKL